MIRLMVGDYASLDAWATFKLVEELEDRLSSEDLQPGITLLDYYNACAEVAKQMGSWEEVRCFC